MHFPKLEILATIPLDEEHLEEGPLGDAARRVVSTVKKTVDKVKAKLAPGTANDDPSKTLVTGSGNNSVVKELENTVDRLLINLNKQVAPLVQKLTRQNHMENLPAEALAMLKSQVGALVSSFRKGTALQVVYSDADSIAYVRESEKLVKKHPTSMFAIYLKNPEAPAEGEPASTEQPKFLVKYYDQFPQRAVNLQRLIDDKHTLTSPSTAASTEKSSDTVAPVEPAAVAPVEKAAVAPVEKAAGSTAPAAAEKAAPPHEAIKMDAASMEQHLSQLWKRWADSGKNASPAMRQLIKRMWLDTGGVKAESTKPRLNSLMELAKK